MDSVICVKTFPDCRFTDRFFFAHQSIKDQSSCSQRIIVVTNRAAAKAQINPHVWSYNYDQSIWFCIFWSIHSLQNNQKIKWIITNSFFEFLWKMTQVKSWWPSVAVLVKVLMNGNYREQPRVSLTTGILIDRKMLKTTNNVILCHVVHQLLIVTLSSCSDR